MISLIHNYNIILCKHFCFLECFRKKSNDITKNNNLQFHNNILFSKDDLYFKDMNIKLNTFNYFFILRVDGLEFDLYECLLTAYIIYERYIHKITSQEAIKLQTNKQIFCIAYLLSIKINNDQIDTLIEDFLEIFGFSQDTQCLFIKYEYMMCTVLNWQFYIDRKSYIKYSEIMCDIGSIKTHVLNKACLKK